MSDETHTDKTHTDKTHTDETHTNMATATDTPDLPIPPPPPSDYRLAVPDGWERVVLDGVHPAAGPAVRVRHAQAYGDALCALMDQLAQTVALS